MFCIDVEPDGFFISRDRRPEWEGFLRTYEYFRDLRQRLEDATKSSVAYLWSFRMDPQIAETYGSADWAIKKYQDIVETCAEQGDDFGLHIHAYRWDEDFGDWIIDHGNQEWIERCVRLGFETYRKEFGRNCEIFRFGDGWINDATLRLIEQLGARFDLTIEPGQSFLPTRHPNHPYTGSIPDLHGIPRQPYRLPQGDFRLPDASPSAGLWLVPMSTCYEDVNSPSWSRILRRSVLPKSRKQSQIFSTLNPAFDSSFFANAVDELLICLENPYLALPLRSDAASILDQKKSLEENISYILNHPLASRFVFCATDDLMKTLGYAA